ncbi:MAG: hypothetical protein J1E37_08775, partial [Prevotella sp.]|nr:hypothetical protein [Prevotella sp.]
DGKGPFASKARGSFHLFIASFVAPSQKTTTSRSRPQVSPPHSAAQKLWNYVNIMRKEIGDCWKRRED